MKKIKLLGLLLFAAFLLKAQPEFYNINSGTTSNNYPLSSGTYRKAQFIFGPNQFNGNGTGSGSPAYLGNISKIFLRMGNQVSSTNYTNFTISLSQTVGTNTSFGSTPEVAYNFETGLTQNFFQASGFNFSGAAPNSWFGIQLNTSFQYNPALSLIVEIKASGGTGNRLTLSDGTVPQRLYGGYSAASATTATGTLNFGFNMIATPLPVLVTHFDGLKEQHDDILSWETSNEQHNDYFNLQYSTDGVHFVTIQKINSLSKNGLSNDVLKYTTKNTNPSIGHNYYRLEQVDLDGQATLETKTIDLVRGNESQEVSIYPNPTSDKINIDFTSTRIQQISMVVIDINGRIVKENNFHSQIGVNNVQIDLSRLPKGTYTICLSENNRVTFKDKIIKQ